MAVETQQPVVRAQGLGVEEMQRLLRDASERFVGLLRSLEARDGDRAVPDMTWTVAETAAHLIGIVGRGLGDRRRADSVDGLRRLNDEVLAETDEHDLREIADRLEADVATLLGRQGRAPEDYAFPLHAGVRADVPTAASYLIFDLLVHGYDIARACGRPWPIPAQDASQLLQLALPALRPWVDPGVLSGPKQRLVVAFSPQGPALAFAVGAGGYDVRVQPTETPDTQVDPAAALLAISRREPSFDPATERLASWYVPI